MTWFESMGLEEKIHIILWKAAINFMKPLWTGYRPSNTAKATSLRQPAIYHRIPKCTQQQNIDSNSLDTRWLINEPSHFTCDRIDYDVLTSRDDLLCQAILWEITKMYGRAKYWTQHHWHLTDIWGVIFYSRYYLIQPTILPHREYQNSLHSKLS
jgi:hypothetical protein